MWSMIVCDGDGAGAGTVDGFGPPVFGGKGGGGRGHRLRGLAGAGRHGKAGAAGRGDRGARQRGGLKHHHQRAAAIRKIIWFSDLDFGVQAYRLCVPFFCKKPVTRYKMEQALTRFMELSQGAGKA